MKAHVGVDMATGLAHTVVGTAGNGSDVTQAHALHGGENAVLGDAGYQGVVTTPNCSHCLHLPICCRRAGSLVGNTPKWHLEYSVRRETRSNRSIWRPHT